MPFDLIHLTIVNRQDQLFVFQQPAVQFLNLAKKRENGAQCDVDIPDSQPILVNYLFPSL
jgi:hypothetical protein